MPNPLGVNPLNPNPVPYGDVKRQQELVRQAPISGAPVAGRALNTPLRDQHRAVRGAPAPQQAQPGPEPPPEAAMPLPQPDIPYAQYVAKAWADLASAQGASDLVKGYAEQAQRDANSGW